ncbi:zona pellucida sperm-binding protein 3-like [Boleophthalmus pectinirostris]|uniref:zona pellucida sperm-binding protein 3-like n=1 Tax=Boleophthalmus pectinirostris TaxID=150288 RepID=UPI00242F803B|nr:zona pellucida sperm-binding protein 3-like [Boleophthalmus pectinirostris]
MWFCLGRFLVIISCFVCSDGEFIKNPELEWDNMSKMTRKVSSEPLLKVFRSGISPQSSNSEFRMLPDFVVVSSVTDQKALFKPERGTRPLPYSVKSLLFPTTVAPTVSTQPKVVEILCHIDRIYVRVRRDIFKTLDAYSYLKLGTCPVNQGTTSHYYFLYLLTSGCDFKKQSSVDHVIVKNVIHYKPTTLVLREMPFDVSIQCNYQRFHHSYKVGIRPKLLGGTLFKSLRRKCPVLLILQDESGNEMTRPFVMGEPMFFEAKQPDGAPTSADDRMYINKCFITPSLVLSSSTNYTVIDNYGCMVDGKESAESRFLGGLSKLTQRFTINAVILKELASSSSTKQLYMHCDVSVGKHPPTQGLKACNYDAGTKTWKELYGYDSLCSCCDSSCSPAQQPRAFRNIVTSQPWEVDLEDDLKMKTLGANFGFDYEEMTPD